MCGLQWRECFGTRRVVVQCLLTKDTQGLGRKHASEVIHVRASCRTLKRSELREGQGLSAHQASIAACKVAVRYCGHGCN